MIDIKLLPTFYKKTTLSQCTCGRDGCTAKSSKICIQCTCLVHSFNKLIRVGADKACQDAHQGVNSTPAEHDDNSI